MSFMNFFRIQGIQRVRAVGLNENEVFIFLLFCYYGRKSLVLCSGGELAAATRMSIMLK